MTKDIPSLAQGVAQHTILDSVESMYVRLKETVVFDVRSVNLAGMGADGLAPQPAKRLVTTSFDIKDNWCSCNAMQHLPKMHQQVIRNGLVGPYGASVSKFASMDLATKWSTLCSWCVNSKHTNNKNDNRKDKKRRPTDDKRQPTTTTCTPKHTATDTRTQTHTDQHQQQHRKSNLLTPNRVFFNLRFH